jgi:hypothetical protein
VIAATKGDMDAQEALSRLESIGFRRVGCWKCNDGQLSLDLDKDRAAEKNILYAFVVDGQPMYIGKSVQSLRVRMNGYRYANESQRTNYRIRPLLLERLGEGKSAEIFALVDNGLLHYAGFHINLAAGLEDSLIRELAPPWNGGKPS